MNVFKKVVILLFIIFMSTGNLIAQAIDYSLPNKTFKKIEDYIEANMKKGKIPGLSVVITNGEETVYNRSFGYSNINNQELVTSNTLFELGSTSKAFTGLGVLYLKELGLIDLEAPVSRYLDWFYSVYSDRSAEIKIKHLLYHTSGIPYNTLGDIPVSNNDTALEDTIRIINGIELDHAPGSEFSYATINYDILGLVIEKITKNPFELFMVQEILKPLELNNIFVNRRLAYEDTRMATGYKLGYLKAREYFAPDYRGNTPAGYFISNSTDIARWLKIQSNSIQIQEVFQKIIKESQIPDKTVLPSYDTSSYAAGWRVFQKGSGEISHNGSNPNFSSYFVIRPIDQIGIAVLSNINSKHTEGIGQGILNIIQDNEVYSEIKDVYRGFDRVSIALLIISGLFSLAILYAILNLSFDFVKGHRSLKSFKAKNIFSVIFSLIFLLFVGYCLYIIPSALFDKLPWNLIEVWGPIGFIISLKVFFVTIALLSVYFQIIFYFPKEKEQPLFPLIILSSISGFGNAFVIFTINLSLNNWGNYDISIILYFSLGILLYIVGQKLISTKMIKITNNMVFDKRINLINKILNSSFWSIEKMEDGKIQAALNNDTEAVSRAPDIIVRFFTSTITLIFCFIYLGLINKTGLLLSIAIILVAVGLYALVSGSASKLWEQTRDIQNTFFKFINDLIGGFKELSLNSQKKAGFLEDIKRSCSDYRDKGTLASLKFVNTGILGELLFTTVIGAVAFIFPLLFTSLNIETARTFIFIFLYMTGPINGILYSVPTILQIRVSWKRINDFVKEISELSLVERTLHKKNIDQKKISLQLSDVKFSFKSDENSFHIGPINFEFNSGEVTFITGGNGSGKTTLAKLITGLYKPDSGNVLLNNKKIHHADLGEYFSHIFSDFYLFKKIYGIDIAEKRDEIDEKLKLLGIRNKVKIIDREFSTIELSQGQRKRLALALSYVDNKEIILFDEWAADQEPEFRKFFYETLIHELKRKNKCIIAITHDDHYFHLADKILKMNMGRIEC